MPTPPLVLGDDGRVVFLAIRRKHPGFKACAFAVYLGVEKSYVSEIETGKRDMPLAFARALAEYLGDASVVFGESLARLGKGLHDLDDVTSEDERIAAEWQAVRAVRQ